MIAALLAMAAPTRAADFTFDKGVGATIWKCGEIEEANKFRKALKNDTGRPDAKTMQICDEIGVWIGEIFE